MKNLLFSLFILVVTPAFLAAQSADVHYSSNTESLIGFSETITEDFLRKHLNVIANDSLRGRDTGTAGLKKAAHYLAGFYRSAGVQPKGVNGTYFQPFELNATITDSLVYTIYRVNGKDTLRVNHSQEAEDTISDYIMNFGGGEPIEGDIVFGGFGVDDSLRGVQNLEGDSIRNNWVLIFESIPYMLEGDTLVSQDYTGRDRFVTLLQDYGARGILLIPDASQAEFNEMSEMNSQVINLPENLQLAYRERSQGSFIPPYAYAYISPERAAEILHADGEEGLQEMKESITRNLQEFRSEKTSFFLEYAPYRENKTIESQNVLAYVEGSDPELRDEVVVLMAHYDHVGIGLPDESGDFIYNGADDNGSGTVGLMAVANAFQEAAKEGMKPKRSILFLHVAAEESGLLGSRYYSDHPVVPIEQTVAALNSDMISRSDPEHIQAGNTDYVYLIGGEIISSQLDSLVQNANQQSVNMQLDRKYNDLDDPNQFYRRSDHWNFGRLSVPFVFFFTGVHEDYHQPSDHVEEVNFEKYTRVTRLIYSSAVNVANFEGRPEVDNQQFIDITGQQPR